MPECHRAAVVVTGAAASYTTRPPTMVMTDLDHLPVREDEIRRTCNGKAPGTCRVDVCRRRRAGALSSGVLLRVGSRACTADGNQQGASGESAPELPIHHVLLRLCAVSTMCALTGIRDASGEPVGARLLKPALASVVLSETGCQWCGAASTKPITEGVRPQFAPALRRDPTRWSHRYRSRRRAVRHPAEPSAETPPRRPRPARRARPQENARLMHRPGEHGADFSRRQTRSTWRPPIPRPAAPHRPGQGPLRHQVESGAPQLRPASLENATKARPSSLTAVNQLVTT